MNPIRAVRTNVDAVSGTPVEGHPIHNEPHPHRREVAAHGVRRPLSAWGTSVLHSSGHGPLESAVLNVRTTGKLYAKGPESASAVAWTERSQVLETGQGIENSLGVVEKSWKAGRTSLFDKSTVPCFSTVVPEGQPNAEATVSERVTLATLWCELAAGLASVE